MSQQIYDIGSSTHTGQYSDFSSETPWRLKTSWIKALHDPATKICSSDELLKHQINKIKTFMAWNYYPKYFRDSFVKRLQQKKLKTRNDNDSNIKI